MKIKEAVAIMNGHQETQEGFLVHFFEKLKGALLRRHFPDIKSGEKLIETEEKAWELARKFTDTTSDEKFVHIYVTDQHHCPVNGYKQKQFRGGEVSSYL